MKYLRKIITVAIAVIFLAAAAIGAGVVFALRNVNITFSGYGGDGSDTVSSVKQAVLDSYRGTVMVFVGEDDIKSCIPDGYTLERFEKIYPCTVNITVKERRETFAVKDGENYAVYDEDGIFLKNSESFLNSKDGAPNVIIEGTADIVSAAYAASAFKRNFSSLRSAVEKITEISAQTSFEESKYVFSLRCGLTVEIRSNKNLEEKLGCAAAVFATLSCEQKLVGTVYCYDTVDGTVKATYNKAA